MLGRATMTLLHERQATFTGADIPAFDFTRTASIDAAVPAGTSVVINCAAYTDVDGAEKNFDLARAINAAGVGRLASRCRRVGAVLVHYSTDYVFDGLATSPYHTDHPKKPINAYGLTKSEGEDAIFASGCDFLLLRTSWLYAPWAKNFVRTIAKLGAEKPLLRVVNDQRGRPTSAEHLAQTTLAMLAASARGVHHATDAGECTWFEFASAIVSGLDLPAKVEPCTSAEFPRPAVRPPYSVLDITSTESLIGPLTPWREALTSVLARLERPL
jgi:dTDP-4-dehydrorhamnose reductase